MSAPCPENNQSESIFSQLKQGILIALQTYSNVHRGSGHNSLVTTRLYEKAREIVLEYLKLDKGKYVVIFCTPRRVEAITRRMKPGCYHVVSSEDIGLPLGIRALAARRSSLPGSIPFLSGGGTARLVSRNWIVRANAPDRYEAGTPAIINIIAFAIALQLIRIHGRDGFLQVDRKTVQVDELLNRDEIDDLSGKELLEQLIEKTIGRTQLVPTVEGEKHFINLDNAASTPTFTPVWETFYKALRLPAENYPHVIREVRSIISGLLGAPLSGYDILFTSNTTESINLVAESLCLEPEPDYRPVVLNTLLEHTSNDLPWRKNEHFAQIRMMVDDDGILDINDLRATLKAYNQDGTHGNERIRLVTVSGASNVLGTFNDLSAISEIVHRYGARLLVDAAQLVAHRKVDMESLDTDYLAFSAHKIYAPFGTGVLVVKKGMLKFSKEELDLIQSSGEENIGGIAALGKSLLLLKRIGLDLIREEEQKLTAHLLSGLNRINGVKVYGIREPESPRFHRKGGVVVFGLKNPMPNIIARELATQGGIGVRYGCHCAHMMIKRLLRIPPRLEWIQGAIVYLFPKLMLPGLVRVSLGIENNEKDIDVFLGVLESIANNTQKRSNKAFASRPDGTIHLPQPEIRKKMNDFIEKSIQDVYLK